jgi:23S rRNA pseudouridine1911/1915/1917 synthase
MHRIDRETSGLVMFAKSREATSHPIKDKKYFAVVAGLPSPTAGVVAAAIDWEYNRGFISEEGKEAVSYYRTLSTSQDYSLLEFTLETGRKHQIRVHASKLLKTPILGDKNYGGPPNKFMLLHSACAEVCGKKYEAPIPPYFMEKCKELGLNFTDRGKI